MKTKVYCIECKHYIDSEFYMDSGHFSSIYFAECAIHPEPFTSKGDWLSPPRASNVRVSAKKRNARNDCPYWEKDK